jgi:2-(1,2-epoxy-1,2-dihydrophenyl)acetyl-CoA isomerase
MRVLLRAWRDEGVGALLVSGSGRAFCTGHDLNSPGLGAAGARVWNELFALLSEIPKPTVAAVNGTAVGGGLHLALACDIALCVDDATIGEPFVWIGASPDTGGHLYPQRSIGHQRAAEMLLLGRKLRGREAAQAGLFMASLATADALNAEALRIATELAEGPHVAYAVTRAGLEYARLHATRDVLEWEAVQEEAMTHTHDMREGVAAFLEKRRPHFRGR